MASQYTRGRKPQRVNITEVANHGKSIYLRLQIPGSQSRWIKFEQKSSWALKPQGESDLFEPKI